MSRPSLRQARAPFLLRLPTGRPPAAEVDPPLPRGLATSPEVPGWFLLSGTRGGVRCRGCGFCRVGREVMEEIVGLFCEGMSGGMVICWCGVVRVFV